MDVQVQVAGQITSKPTNNGGTKFDIPLSNGMKASTFDAALATKVSQLGAAVFTARIEQKPNPRGGAPYTNITDAAGPGEQLFPEIPGAGSPLGMPAATPFVPVGGGIAPQTSGFTPIVPAPQGGGGGGGAWTPETTVRVTKLAVIGTAYALVGQLLHGTGVEALEDAKALADDLARKLYTDARSHEPGAVPDPQPAPATVQAPVAAPVAQALDPALAAAMATGDPAQVAAAVAALAQQAGAPVQVGAEGVVPAAEPAVLPWATA